SVVSLFSFLSNVAPTTAIYTLSLHDALPISLKPKLPSPCLTLSTTTLGSPPALETIWRSGASTARRSRAIPTFWSSLSPLSSERSEEHTSELQSRENLVCRLLLEKKKERPRI